MSVVILHQLDAKDYCKKRLVEEVVYTFCIQVIRHFCSDEVHKKTYLSHINNKQFPDLSNFIKIIKVNENQIFIINKS